MLNVAIGIENKCFKAWVMFKVVINRAFGGGKSYWTYDLEKQKWERLL